MWIEELKNGKFKYIERYEDYMTGKPRRVSVTLDKKTASAKKQAQAALTAKIEQALGKNVVKSKDLTLKELVEEYRKRQLSTVKKSTYKRNYHACNTLMKILGEDTIVSRLNSKYMVDCMLATGKKSSTLNEHLVRFKALIRWGYRNNLIKDISFLDKIEKFDDVPHKVKIKDKYMESEEAYLVLNDMTVQKWKDLTEFLILSGLRIGEALALEINDVDFKNRQIHVTKTFDLNNDETTTPKTTESIRDVYIQDDLLPLCRELKNNAYAWKMVNKINLFFQDKKGRYRYAAYNKYLKNKTLKNIGRKLTPHALRHTHVSLLAEQRVSFDIIARRVGHEDSEITKEIYFHVTKNLKAQDDSDIKSIHIL